jgi:hypothetical protein
MYVLVEKDVYNALRSAPVPLIGNGTGASVAIEYRVGFQ